MNQQVTPPAGPPAGGNYGAPPPPPASPKKTSPWLWVGVGCLSVIVLGGAATAAGGYLLYSKVKEVGDDPVAAVAQAAALADPDLDFVDADSARGKVTLLKKSTGEKFTVDYSDVKGGKIQFSSGDETATVGFKPGSIDGDGEGGLTVTTDEGVAKFGGDVDAADLPAWLPPYPGATLRKVMSSTAKDVATATYALETSDAPEQVAAFFREQIKRAGLSVAATATQGKAMTIIATSEDKKRNVHLVVTREDEKTTGIVNVTEKL